MYARRASIYKAPSPPGGVPLPDHWWKLNQGAAIRQVPDDGSLGTIPVDLIDGSKGSVVLNPNRNMANGWIGAAFQNPDATGEDDYSRIICISNPGFDGATKVSLTIRTNKRPFGAQPGDQRIFSCNNGPSEGDHVFMVGLTNNNTTIRARIRRSGSTGTYVSSVTTSNDVDEFYGFVLDFSASGNELLIYKDAVLADNINISGSSIDAGLSNLVTLIGGNKGTSSWVASYQGYLADCRLWLDKALTQEEITNIYNDI